MAKGSSEYRGAPARVVFADDDAVLRELLRGLLSFLPHVTVVGEAADGIEAVQLVAHHYPDTVLLNITMPRLDVFGAAEVIRSFRPQTRLMLHTGEPDDQKRQRAQALGLPLLDKLQLNATTDLVEQYAVSDEPPLATDIEPLVLLALAGRADAGVLVVKEDESIPFYNPAVAAVLDLPFPPERDYARRPPRPRRPRAPRRRLAVPARRAATRAGLHRPHPCHGRDLSPRRGWLATAVHHDLAALLQSRRRTDRGRELRHRRWPPPAASYRVTLRRDGLALSESIK